MSYLLDAKTGTELRALAASAAAVAFHEEKGKMRHVVAGWDARSFDAETGDEALPPTGRNNYAQCIALSPNGRYVAAGGYNPKPACQWDLSTGKANATHSIYNQVLSVGFDPEVRVWFAAGQDATTPLLMQVGGVDTVKPPLQVQGAAHIYTAAMSPDGRYIVAGYFNGQTLVWDRRTGTIVRSFNVTGIYRAQFLSDGRHLLVYQVTGNKSQVLDLENLEEKQAWPYPAYLLGDDRIALLKEKDGLLLEKIGTTYQEKNKVQTLGLSRAAFSHDGKRLAGVDTKVKVIDTQTGAVLWEWQPPHFHVGAVELSPDGLYLFTANSNGTVYVIKLP